jgi:hypothetical protein
VRKLGVESHGSEPLETNVRGNRVRLGTCFEIDGYLYVTSERDDDLMGIFDIMKVHLLVTCAPRG